MSELRQQTLEAYLGSLAARRSTPGGGAVAAIVAAEAAALIAMVAEFSDTDQSPDITLQCRETIESLMSEADADAIAFKQVMQAYKTGDDLPAALTQAANVPARVSELATALLPATMHLAEGGNQNLISDIGIAASLLDSALTACEMNIRINLNALDDPPTRLLTQLESMNVARASLLETSTRVMRQLS